MAFKASNVVPQNAYALVKGAAVQLKLNANAFISQLAANNATYEFLRDIYRTLDRAKGQFTTLAATPGLADYAKTQENDATYDVVAEFTAMQSAITTAMAWMENNVPLNVTVKPITSWDDTQMISTTFTPAQTSGLRTVLNAVVSTIA